MSDNSKRLSTNSSDIQSSDSSKRKQTEREDNRRPKRSTTDMENRTGFSKGRGRGFRSPNTQFNSNNGASSSTPTVGSTPSPPRAIGRKSPHRDSPEEDTELLKQKRLREKEAKAGITIDFLDSFFRIGDDSTAQDIKPNFRTPTSDWYFKKEEIKEEEEEDKHKDKKYMGKQYVAEAVEREKQRVIRMQREEQASTSGADRRSSDPENSRPDSRNNMNASMLSIHTTGSISTNIESVGTFRPLNTLPQTVEEDEQMPNIIDRYFKDRPRRTPLPIADYEEKIIDAIAVNRVVIIEGATGCGKTTQVPQYIADECASKGIPFNIVVTQPRRIAAKSIAARVAQERNWTLGTIVGYQIGMDRTKVNEDTRLLYCTTGVLLQRLINTQRLEHYSHIIIDEVHERSIDTDLLLLVIKKLMSVRTLSVKIILMSATFDVSILQDYFTLPILHDDEEINDIRPTHIQVEEQPHELHIYYLAQMKRELAIQEQVRDIREFPSPTEKDAPCISVVAMEVAVAILEKGVRKLEEGKPDPKGAVLVFLPGLEEIHEMKARLERSPQCSQQQWKIHPLHSSIPLDKQNLIFFPSRGQERKIILATNIAESSITVPDVAFVIDFCLTKNMICDMETHIPVLRMEWASKSNCNQRAGRAGRLSTGRCYRLVDSSFYNRFQDYCPPELVRSPLDLSILRVKMLKMGSPKELLGLALDPPDLSDIYHSVLQLKQVGAFAVKVTIPETGHCHYNDEDGDITTLGVIMSHLPIDIRLSKLIVIGHVFDVLEETIIIAACLSTQGMFRRDFAQGLRAYKSRLAWADRSFSDSMAFLNAYKMFKKFDADFQNNKSMAEKWCKQNFIQHKRVLEVDYMIGELIERLRRENIVIAPKPNLRRTRHEEELILKVVMCAAFYPNYFTRNEIVLENIPRMLGNTNPHTSVLINGFPPNEGPLYSNEIRDLFSICSNRMDMTFEDTKAYLTFLDDNHPLKEAFDLQIPLEIKGEWDNRSQSSQSQSMMSIKSDRDTPMSTLSMSTSTSTLAGSYYNIKVKNNIKDTIIKTAVYVAVAMRNYREVIKDIPKLNERVVIERLKKLDKIKTEENNKSKTFNSNRVMVPHVMSRIKIEKLNLPTFDCSELEIRVTHIEDPSNFWAQYSHAMTTDYLNQLSFLINIELNTKACESETARVGDLVIAEFIGPDGAKMHGRAVIQHLEYKPGTKEVDKATVFFIDYGYTQTFYNINDLAQDQNVTQSLFDIPPQAFKCCLSQVNPSAISCYYSCWSKKSIDRFKEFVHKEKNVLTAKIYSIVNRTFRLELYNENRSECFNDNLISLGFAEKWEESQASRLNHEQRRRTQLTTATEKLGKLILEPNNQKGVYNPDEIIEVEIDKNPNERISNIRSHDKITIRGPFSPLECSFTGLTQQTANRSVRIDRDSVNCVVLESDYLSKHTRLLVASSVGLSSNSGNINLRDTTLMPNIKGFPAMMALLFAPRVQLRANKEKTQFVGAICGIGYNETMKSYDPDYDAEIVFDTDITLHDLVKINLIRFHITSLLESAEALRDYSEGSLAIKQRKVRRLIIQLLDRRRRLMDFSQYYPTHKWIDISANGRSAEIDSDKSDAAINKELLPICELPEINDFDWYEDVAKNIKDLRATETSEISVTTKCKLCKFTAYTNQDISSHLHSNEHLDQVHDFNKDYKINEIEKIKETHFTQESKNLEQIEEEDEEENENEFAFDYESE